jgi:hypothetical protein
MKKITNLLIVCSLALAGAVTAQQPTPESQPPGKKPDKKAPAEVKPRAPHAPKADAPVVKEPAAAAQPPAANEPAATKPEKKAPSSRKPAPAATAPETKTEQPAASAPPADKKQHSRKPAPAATASETKTEQPAAITPPADRKQHSAESKKDKKAPAPNANAPTTPAATQAASTPATAKAIATPATAVNASPAATAASTAPAAMAPASAAPSISQTSPAKPVNPAAAKKPEPQKVEQIRQQHMSFHAEARPDKVPPVTFTANYRIHGSDQWQGPQYEVYRSYRPERHDQGWYRSRYQRVELIGGGYYYFHNNYWYPAWGYNPTNEYYAYDAPVYAGKHAEPPDKVIADVQAVLQEMGYYKGEVDGLLGPLTREALTGYQTDQGMVATAVIDEPTLDSLGMG